MHTNNNMNNNYSIKRQSTEHDYSTCKETITGKESYNVFKHSNDFQETINNTDKDDDNNTKSASVFPQIKTVKRGFGKFRRKLIFFLIFAINILINFDHGSIAAGATTLMKELNLDHVSLGLIGSLVYLGLTFGASSAGPLFNNYSPKWIVATSIGIACFFLYYFTLVQTSLGLGLCRFGCGFFQIFSLIYFPVWVDQFGVYDHRTMWLSFLQLGVPLGTMLGYVFEAFSIRVCNNVCKILF
jgi:hypothetical protein